MEHRDDALSQLVRTSFEPELADAILSTFDHFVTLASDPGTRVGLSLAGPFTATGHRLDGLAALIEGSYVDWLVARGEDLYLDAEAGFEQACLLDARAGSRPEAEARAEERREGTAADPGADPHAAATSGADDLPAAPEGASRDAEKIRTGEQKDPGERIRIGDQVYHRNQVFSTEEFLGRLVVTPPFQKILATAELNDLLGKFLAERDKVLGLPTPTSVLAAAHRKQVPVFSDSPAGSVVGRRIASAALSGNRLVLDLSRDVNLAAAIVLRNATEGRSVAVSIGGGSPRDMLLHAALHLENPLGLGAHYYQSFLEIAKPGRARLRARFPQVWQEDERRLAVVELASDLALPLLSAFWLRGPSGNEPRQLFGRKDELLEELRDVYLRRNLERQVRQTGALIQSQIQSKIEETQATFHAEVSKVQQQLQAQLQKLLQQMRPVGTRGRRDESE